MKTKNMLSLKKYDKVFHKQFGESSVIEIIPGFGPIILPLTKEGLEYLSRWSGAGDTPYLATDYKQNLTPINKTKQ